MRTPVMAYLGLSAVIVGAAFGLFGAYAFEPVPVSGVVLAVQGPPPSEPPLDRPSVPTPVAIVPPSVPDFPAPPSVFPAKAGIHLLFVGDLMFDRTVADRIKAHAKVPLYPLDRAHGFFTSFDAVIGNLEGPVTPTRRPPVKSLDFAFASSVPALLREAGMDAVSQANNHSLDQGREGAADSLRALGAAGLIAFGDEVHDDAASARGDLVLRGQHVAVLGFNASEGPIDRAQAAAALSEARATAERVIVFMHWGGEYQDRPNAAQVGLGHWLIDQGADAVVGAHPHWVQSVEAYKGRPIAYSLGNFVFDQDFSEATRQGLAVSIAFTATGTSLGLYPARIEASRPRFLEGAERQARLDALTAISDASLGTAIRAGHLELTPLP